jgi:hypothetical protein
VTTPARQKEADAVELAYHNALIAIGLKSREDALAIWQDIPKTGAARSGGWIRRLLAYIANRRKRTRALAIAKHRLVRALRTGATISMPGAPAGRTTIGELVQDFSRLSGAAVRTGLDAATPVAVEQITLSVAELDRLERDAQREAEIVLDALGPRTLTSKLDELDLTAPAEDVDAKRDEAHLAAGRRQAAATERLVLNGARSASWAIHGKDSKVVGYVRFSTTGTPCGWCAMLISRGPVYRTAMSAQYAEGDLYHDNCKCDVMPVFSTEQYDSSDLFELNRKYSALWPKVTQGLSGRAALTAWRRFIRQEQAAARAQEAASPTTNVQEA